MVGLKDIVIVLNSRFLSFFNYFFFTNMDVFFRQDFTFKNNNQYIFVKKLQMNYFKRRSEKQKFHKVKFNYPLQQGFIHSYIIINIMVKVQLENERYFLYDNTITFIKLDTL